MQDSLTQRRFDRLSFRFTDASVPPPYHRSYSIEINEKRVLHFTVTDYSETLHQEDISLSEAQWKSLVAKSQKLEKANSKIAKGATGTSQRRIVLFQGEKEVYNLHWDSLNKVNKGTEDFLEQLKALIPDFANKMKKS